MDLSRQEEIIRDLKSTLYKYELELEGAKTLNESLQNKITNVTNNEIELTHLKRENNRLRDECIKSRQEKEDGMSLNYALSEQVKKLQEEVNFLKMGGNPNNYEESVNHPCSCDSCKVPISGIRYKCGHCADFDFCSLCIGSNHDNDHMFLKFRYPVHIDSRVILLSPFGYRPSNSTQHVGIYCDICHEQPICGIRYKCGHCSNFDVCSKCEANISKLHDKSHVFIRITRPVFTPGVILPTFIPNNF